MHVGMSVIFQGLESRSSDAQVWTEQLELADRAEANGFDSLWTAEHHFSSYLMSPNPAQFLTFMAARTKTLRLGSMVMVIPWHDPVRLTEEISVLDHLSGGRAILGFGRGLGPIEFDGFRLEMGESRQRFVEYAEAIVQGLSTGSIEYAGGLYQQPRVEIRPTPFVSLRGRVYASAVSPESAKIMAQLGFGLLIIAQKPWMTTIAEIESYRALYEDLNGEPPPRPALVNFTNIHSDAERAQEHLQTYGMNYSRSAVSHYDFMNERLATVPGYEYYAKLREGIQKRGLDSFARFLAELQIAGTPAQVADATVERIRALDAGGVINVFSFGGMPHDLAQESLDLYVRDVLPVLKGVDEFRSVG